MPSQQQTNQNETEIPEFTSKYWSVRSAEHAPVNCLALVERLAQLRGPSLSCTSLGLKLREIAGVLDCGGNGVPASHDTHGIVLGLNKLREELGAYRGAVAAGEQNQGKFDRAVSAVGKVHHIQNIIERLTLEILPATEGRSDVGLVWDEADRVSFIASDGRFNIWNLDKLTTFVSHAQYSETSLSQLMAQQDCEGTLTSRGGVSITGRFVGGEPTGMLTMAGSLPVDHPLVEQIVTTLRANSSAISEVSFHSPFICLDPSGQPQHPLSIVISLRTANTECHAQFIGTCSLDTETWIPYDMEGELFVRSSSFGIHLPACHQRGR